MVKLAHLTRKDPMKQALILKFTPEGNDYVRASRMLSTKAPVFLITAVVMGIIVLASLLLLIFPDIGDPSWRGIAIVFLITGVFYLVYFALIIPIQLKNAFKKNSTLQEPRKFTISDANITMVISGKASILEWENVKKLIQSQGSYLILYEAGERFYPFIPNRAFEDEATEEAFLDFFKAKAIEIR